MLQIRLSTPGRPSQEMWSLDEWSIAESAVISIVAPPLARPARAELHKLWRSPVCPSPGAAVVFRNSSMSSFLVGSSLLALFATVALSCCNATARHTGSLVSTRNLKAWAAFTTWAIFGIGDTQAPRGPGKVQVLGACHLRELEPLLDYAPQFSVKPSTPSGPGKDDLED